MKRLAFTLIELLVVIVIVLIAWALILPLGVTHLIQGFFITLFGWIPRTAWLLMMFCIQPKVPLVGIVIFLGLTVLLHLVMRIRPKTLTWKFRQSVAVIGLVYAVFLVFLGLGFAWNEGNEIANPKDVMVWSPAGVASRDVRSRSNLRSIAHAANNYISSKESLPQGGTLLEDGQPGHGWMTQLMPYLDMEKEYEKIDFNKPWDAPENLLVFQQETPYPFFSYKIGRGKNTRQNFEGFGLTDYAANEHIIPFGRSIKLDDIIDGPSNTILCGEVTENLKPWGSPFNSRDLALGVNRSPHGFGYEKPFKTVNFVMCDGSVISLSENADPNILCALATPNGGEPSVPKEELTP